MAVDSTPRPYRATLAGLRRQKPRRVFDADWKIGIDDMGTFLGRWGNLAVQFGWTPDDLFEAPCDGKCGLVWFLEGQTVLAPTLHRRSPRPRRVPRPWPRSIWQRWRQGKSTDGRLGLILCGRRIRPALRRSPRPHGS